MLKFQKHYKVFKWQSGGVLRQANLVTPVEEDSDNFFGQIKKKDILKSRAYAQSHGDENSLVFGLLQQSWQQGTGKHLLNDHTTVKYGHTT